MRLKYLRLFLVVAIATILLSCGGAEERKAKYLDRGKAYLADKNYEKATIEFKNVLQIDPKYAEAYFLMGETEEKKRDVAKAFGNYSKAVDLDPHHYRARIKLAKIYFSVGQIDKADEHINYVLKKEPNNPEANTLHAFILAQKGDPEAAIKLASKVLNADPKQTEAAILIAAIDRRLGKIDQAIEILERSAATNPKDVTILSSLAPLYFTQKDVTKTGQVLQKIVALEPDVLDHRVNLAAFYSQTKHLDKAEQTLREAIHAAPSDPDRYLLLADFLISQHRGEKFESELTSAIQAHPKVPGLRFALAAYYLKLNKPAQAESVYNQIIDLDSIGPDGMKARKQLAELFLRENKSAQASVLIAAVLKDNPQDAQALLLRGKIEITQVPPDGRAAVADFRSVLKSQPESIEVLTLLARAHQVNNEPGLAKEALQKAVRAAPKDPDPTIRLAKFLMINDNDKDGALRVLNEFLTNSPDNLPVLEAKLVVLDAKNDAAGVTETISSMKKMYPDKPVGYFHAGEFLTSQGKYQEALREFEQARDRAKSEFRPVAAIAKLYLKLGNRPGAIKALDDYLTANPANLDAMQTKASILASANDAPGFFKVIDDIKRAYPDKPYGYFLAGEYFLSQKTYDKARDELKEAAVKAPDADKVAEELTKAYVGAGQGDDAIVWLQRVAKNKPTDAMMPYLIGEVRAAQGKSTEAIEALQQSIKLDPKHHDAYNKLAQEYIRLHNFDAAIKVYRQGMQAIPGDDGLQFNLASIYESTGRFAEAMELYEALLKKNPRNILAANNLASLLTDHKSDKASLERAKALAAPFENSNQPALIDTLGWVYFKLGDVDRAIVLLKKATTAAPSAAVLHYHLGMAYYKKGDKTAAKDELTRAFAADPKLAGADDGRTILKGL
ncbi:MAG: tetratricopeptide repeat protein [Gammaproteobacteria bacterium]